MQWWILITVTLWRETTCPPCCPRSGPSCLLSCSRTPTARSARERDASWWCCKGSSATSLVFKVWAQKRNQSRALFFVRNVLPDRETRTSSTLFEFLKLVDKMCSREVEDKIFWINSIQLYLLVSFVPISLSLHTPVQSQIVTGFVTVHLFLNRPSEQDDHDVERNSHYFLQDVFRGALVVSQPIIYLKNSMHHSWYSCDVASTKCS